MAATLLSHVVSDLCIGRPRVLTLPTSTPIAAALAAGADPFVFVDAELGQPASRATKIVAAAYVKIGIADILCYVCDDAANLRDPEAALGRPVSAIAAAVGGGVARRVDPHTSLLDAIDALLTDGCQGLFVPLHARDRSKRNHHISSDAVAAADCCVLTRENIVCHLFSSISHFSPVAALTVASLGLVRRDVHSVHVDDEGLDAIPLLKRAISDGTAVAIVDDEEVLVGEICPSVLGACDVVSVSAAFAALSAGDVMTYIDCSLSHATPEFLVRAIRSQLKDRGLDAMAELMDTWDVSSLPQSPSSSLSSLSTSSDDDSPLSRARRSRRVSSRSFSWRSTEDVVTCHSGSSLVAVMAQALAHRVGYVWVVDEASGALIGVVGLAYVLAVLREQIRPQVVCR